MTENEKIGSSAPTTQSRDSDRSVGAKNASIKAVISTGGKQYLVSEGDELDVELLNPAESTVFQALLVVNGDKINIGQPIVEGVQVTADITEQTLKADKVVAIRYKAKKRVHKRRGHRQSLTRIKITKIA